MSRQAIVKQILQEGDRLGATRKQKKAAIAAGIVESGLQNLSGGDRDSIGVFQIRSGIHGPIGKSVRQSARWFFKNAKQADHGQGSGQLAQDVERSAFPGKYSAHSVQAQAGSLLRHGGGAGRGGAVSRTPGIDNSQGRAQALLSYFRAQRGEAPTTALDTKPYYGKQGFQTLMSNLHALKDTPSKTTRTAVPRGTGRSSQAGTVMMDGYPVNASIAADLKYARAHGWKGKVTDGYRSDAQQARYYSEFKAGKRSGPVAPPGQSMHRFKRPGKGAVDVSDGANLQKYLPKNSRLKYAGSRDPVHYSQGAPAGSY